MHDAAFHSASVTGLMSITEKGRIGTANTGAFQEVW